MGYEADDARDYQRIPIVPDIKAQFSQDFAHFRNTLITMSFMQRLRFCVSVMRGTV